MDCYITIMYYYPVLFFPAQHFNDLTCNDYMNR